MKSIRIILTLIMALAFVAGQSQPLEIVTPTNKKLDKTRVYSGKNINYYPLSKRKAVVVEIRGNDELFIFTRLRLNKESLNTYYTLAYSFDDNKQIFKKRLSIGRPAKGVAYSDRSIKERASVLRKVKVKVPKGARLLKVFVDKDGGHDIDASFSGKKNRKNSSDKAKRISPLEAPNDSIVLIVGKRRTFYSLKKKDPLTINVKGPGELYVFSRTRFEINQEGKKVYSINYKLDGKLVKSKTYKYTSASEAAIYADRKLEKLPSKLKKFVVKIPPGKHKLSFEASKIGEEVDVYFRFRKRLKPEWKSLALYEEKETSKLKVIGKDVMRSYARIRENESVTVKVTGPTKIRVYVRAEFEYHMHSNNNIRVLAHKNGKLLNTFVVSSKRTKTVEYNNRDDLVPGTLNKIYIDVPKGDHEYSFSLKDKNKSALVRIAYDENLKKHRNKRS